MESEDQYFHQLLLLSPKPIAFPFAASDNLYSSSPQPPPPQPPHPPSVCAANGGICSSQSRWPRQETLTLLEIRARLDPQFREGGQKAPLWDEVARIMTEEYGYQRSGKKCREKLDNLYKYYKKTKEGKIGKQEGKNYRFFRQLEALYSPSTIAAVHSSNLSMTKNLNLLANQNTLLFSTSSDSSAEEEEEEEEEEEHSRTKSWITELVEAQMKRLLEIQEAWFQKMMKSFERMEQERVQREENWRREEAERRESERRRLASERAWVEERDASLISALEKIIQQRECLGAPALMADEGDEGEEMECELSRAMGVL